MMANGGVIAPVGMNMVALAAQRHSVPFVVLAGVHKVFCCKADFSFAFFEVTFLLIVVLFLPYKLFPFSMSSYPPLSVHKAFPLQCQ